MRTAAAACSTKRGSRWESEGYIPRARDSDSGLKISRVLRFAASSHTHSSFSSQTRQRYFYGSLQQQADSRGIGMVIEAFGQKSFINPSPNDGLAATQVYIQLSLGHGG